jgi:two-component system nitrate/nitrite response regulator NarL
VDRADSLHAGPDGARDHVGVDREEAAVVDAAEEVVERRMVLARQRRACVAPEPVEEAGLVGGLARRVRDERAGHPRRRRRLGALERRVVEQLALDELLDLASRDGQELGVGDQRRGRAHVERKGCPRAQLEGHRRSPASRVPRRAAHAVARRHATCCRRTVILVFVVSPVRVYRDGLAQLLDGRGELRVLGSAGTVEQALGQIVDLGPDVVLVDTDQPASVAGVRVIAVAAPASRVVALAAREDDRSVIACAEAGVAAFVSRDGTLDDVVATALAVVRGEAPCPPRVAAALLRRVSDAAAERPHGEVSALTSRERQVVALIDEGLSNKEIAASLCIELSTVKNHVHNLLEKLGARGRTEAAARARTVLRPVSVDDLELRAAEPGPRALPEARRLLGPS